MENKTKVALYIRKKVEYVREFSITWKQIHTNKRVDQLGWRCSIHTNKRVDQLGWRCSIHTNKCVDQLGWRCSILSKVLGLRFKNNVALNTYQESFATLIVLPSSIRDQLGPNMIFG